MAFLPESVPILRKLVHSRHLNHLGYVLEEIIKSGSALTESSHN